MDGKRSINNSSKRQSNIQGKLTRNVQNLYEAKYKTLSKDIEENLNICGEAYIYNLGCSVL